MPDEDSLKDLVEDATKVLGRTDDAPDLQLHCPSCEGRVDIYNASNLPIRFQCVPCSALYEIKEQGAEHEIAFVREI